MMKPWKIVLLLLAVNIVLRVSTLFQTIVNIDEAQFGQFALAMIRGFPPYVGMLGEKPMLLYAYFYAILSFFGTFNLFAVHVVTIIWVTTTALIIFAILRRVLEQPWAVSGAVLFSILATLGDFKMISSDGEALMNLPLCLSALTFILSRERRRWWLMLLTGLFIGAAGQFRYQAGIQLAVVGSYLLLYEPFRGGLFGKRWRILFRGVGDLTLIVLTFLLTYAMAFLYLRSVGSWDEFVFWTLKFELSYIKTGMETISGLERGVLRTVFLILIGFPFWWAAVKTVIQWLKQRSTLTAVQEGTIVFCFLWFLWGFVAVSVGGRFAFRYFTQIVPPLALLAAMSIPPTWFSKGWSRLRQGYGGLARWAMIGPALILWGLRFFSPWINEAFGELDYAPFQKEIGAYLESHSDPDDLVYVWGWGNGIYFYANRFPATRFLTSDFLTGRIPGSPTAHDLTFDTSYNIVPGSWEMFQSDLERDQPLYIVDTSLADIHDYKKYPIQKFPLLWSYLRQHYILETILHDVALYRRR